MFNRQKGITMYTPVTYKNREKRPDFYPNTGISVELVNVRNIHPHYHHDTLEFIYCLKGKVYVNVAHELCTINECEIVTVDQDDIRNIFAEDDNITLIIHLDLNDSQIPIEDLRNTLFSCATLLSSNKTYYINEAIDYILSLIFAECLFQEGIKNEIWFVDICRSIRLNIIDLMVEKFSWFSIYDDPEDDMKYRERMRQIIAYVSQHYKEKITLSHLSEVLYLNPAYISAFLRRASFNSFTDLINYYRCLNAQKLLLETATPVGDISELCGFSSEKYFYRSFKQFFDTTPLKYRKHFAAYTDQKEEYTRFEPQHSLEIIKNHITERHIEKSRRRP